MGIAYRTAYKKGPAADRAWTMLLLGFDDPDTMRELVDLCRAEGL